MKAHELIDRLASLDEATIVEEPPTDPETMPEEPVVQPGAPSRRPSHNPYEMPPDFDPDAMPRPKAGEDEAGTIETWLQATQQPIQDWEWDGQELRLLMDDGTTEVYNRRQLEQIGIFGGEMTFAESEEDEGKETNEPETDFPSSEDMDGPDMETVQAAIDAESKPTEDATGTLDMILGRTPCSAAAEAPAEPEVIELDGATAEKLGNAISDVVSAILGVVQGGSEPDNESPDKNYDKKDDKSDTKKKKNKPKPKAIKDKENDKESDKKDDEKEE